MGSKTTKTYQKLKKILRYIIYCFLLAIFSSHLQKKLDIKFQRMFNLNDLSIDSISQIKTVLLLTAHPDDEIMFLSPTLKKLKSLGVKVKILCMCTGNYNGLGKQRIEEFNTVSKSVNMIDNKIIDHPEMQDHLYKPWNINVVASTIKEYLNNNEDIGTIITFDERGVTKHPNHISVHKGLMQYINENKKEIKERNINIYFFDTFSPLTQYTMIVPFITMYFKDVGFFDWNLIFSWTHMKLYKTQFNFPRRMHVIFSGYTYNNSFKKLMI